MGGGSAGSAAGAGKSSPVKGTVSDSEVQDLAPTDSSEADTDLKKPPSTSNENEEDSTSETGGDTAGGGSAGDTPVIASPSSKPPEITEKRSDTKAELSSTRDKDLDSAAGDVRVVENEQKNAPSPDGSGAVGDSARRTVAEDEQENAPSPDGSGPVGDSARRAVAEESKDPSKNETKNETSSEVKSSQQRDDAAIDYSVQPEGVLEQGVLERVVVGGDTSPPPADAEPTLTSLEPSSDNNASSAETKSDLEQDKRTPEVRSKDVGEKPNQGSVPNQGSTTPSDKAENASENFKERPSVVHWGVACDVTGQNPIRGVRWTKRGHDYDLCQEAYDALSAEERASYDPIYESELPPPGESQTLAFGGLTEGLTQGLAAAAKAATKAAGKGFDVVKKSVAAAQERKIAAVVKAAEVEAGVAAPPDGGPSAAELQKLERQNSVLASELSERDQEIQSLRQVWTESRASLERLRAALRAGEAKHRSRLAEKEVEHVKALKAKDASAQRKVVELKKQMLELRREHEVQLEAQTGNLTVAGESQKEAERRCELLEKEAADLRASVAKLEERAEELVKEREDMSAEHAKALHRLREEQERRDKAKAAATRVHSDALSQFKTREGYLEANNAEFASALAAQQRQIEEKTRELERVEAEAKWIRADRKAAEEQLSAVKERLVLEERAHEKHRAEAQQTAGRLTANVRSLETRVRKISEQLSARALRIRELESQLEARDTGGAEGDQDESAAREEFETKIKNMADHLLAKQSEIDRVTAHRNALALQLEQEQRAVKTLEKKVRAMRSSPDAAYYRDRARDGATGVSLAAASAAAAMGGRAGPAVVKAMSILDSFSAFVSVTLRRNPAARLFFGIYVVIIHVWVLFVLFHMMGQDGADHVGPSIPPGMGGTPPGLPGGRAPGT